MLVLRYVILELAADVGGELAEGARRLLLGVEVEVGLAGVADDELPLQLGLLLGCEGGDLKRHSALNYMLNLIRTLTDDYFISLTAPHAHRHELPHPALLRHQTQAHQYHHSHPGQ